MGVHVLMGGVIRATIQPNMERLMGDVQQGTLDFALTKPADSQVLVSVREIRIWQTVDIVVGLVLVTVAVYQLQSTLSISAVAGFLIALLLGAMTIYSFWLMLTTGAFWIVRMDQIVELFQGVYQAGRWPVGIYPGWLRTGLTFLVPIAFAVTVPAEALTGRLTWQTLLGAAFLSLALMFLARRVWRIGLRHYSGASA
jgi:ABC-2 type transport system permease protein